MSTAVVEPLHVPLPSFARRVVVDWADVASWGTIRERTDGRLYLQFGRRRIYSDHGAPFRDAAHARSVLETVRQLARQIGKPAAVDRFAPTAAAENACGRYLDLWLQELGQSVLARDLSPRTLRERRRWCRDDGHIGAYWRQRSIYSITTPEITRWVAWLAERKGGLSGKTRWNIASAFHRFVSWLVEQEALERVPTFRWPRKDRRLPTIVGQATQDAILEAIAAPARGAFLAMARLGIRPSEAVVLQRGDLRGGWVHVARARKDRQLDAPIWGTKTGSARLLPVPEDLAAWIEEYSSEEPGALLFPNPLTGRAWSETALRRTWIRARKEVGVEVGLYEGTKHSTATALRRRGVPMDVLQRLLGHADARSTELYAQLEDAALVEALRPARQGAQKPRSRVRRHPGAGRGEKR